jgi:Ankyrin repeats (many copies)
LHLPIRSRWACRRHRPGKPSELLAPGSPGLQAGAEVNAQTDEGWSPLMLAVRSGARGLVARLLADGADVRLRDRDGCAALHAAVAAADRAAFNLLYSSPAACLTDVDAKGGCSARRRWPARDCHRSAVKSRSAMRAVLEAVGDDLHPACACRDVSQASRWCITRWRAAAARSWRCCFLRCTPRAPCRPRAPSRRCTWPHSAATSTSCRCCSRWAARLGHPAAAECAALPAGTRCVGCPPCGLAVRRTHPWSAAN